MKQAAQKEATGLKGLAQAGFGTLSAAENLLLEKIATGDSADCSKLDDKGNDPKESDKWEKARQIRADLVAWLCTNEQAREHIHWRGIQVCGADVAGRLDLSFVSIPFPLRFQYCRLREDINLRRTEVPELHLQDSVVHGIKADIAAIKNAVFLRNATVVGEAAFDGAQIGGNFECDGGTFSNERGMALNAERIMIKGSIFLRSGFTAKGEVRLLGAEISGSLECNAGMFNNGNGVALKADGINVKGAVFLINGFTANGEVSLTNAQIDGQLVCVGGVFSNPAGPALTVERVKVRGSVFLGKGFAAEGVVNMTGAEIGGDFVCVDGNFHKATLGLTDASAGTLIDSGLNEIPSAAGDYPPTKWPQVGKLFLDGFTYDRILPQAAPTLIRGSAGSNCSRRFIPGPTCNWRRFFGIQGIPRVPCAYWKKWRTFAGMLSNVARSPLSGASF